MNHRAVSSDVATKGEGGQDRSGGDTRGGQGLFGALDLGTNNCRLLVATRQGGGFRVVDGFSRIVRLGEGLADTGALSNAAMDRALDALRICSKKLRRHRIERVRCVATQACRGALNGEEFVKRVKTKTGIALEVIDPGEEARLAVLGCLGLMDLSLDAALVIDIGGGSTELSWVDLRAARDQTPGQRIANPPIVAWASYPVGVVNLAERFPETADRAGWYGAMVEHVREEMVWPAEALPLMASFHADRAHIIGTSGAVTSLAGVHLDLPRYDRQRVDGLWVSRTEVRAAADRLCALDFAQRSMHPCVGPERADLVLAGGAILEAIVAAWPCHRLRVADRGLREGLLMSLMHVSRRRRRRRRRRGVGRGAGRLGG